MDTQALPFEQLQQELEGVLYFDLSPSHQGVLLAYATDASVYQEKPLAVALPKSKADLIALIQFAKLHQVTLIPRTAGTSLAGQVVGKGIIMDLSKYFNRILSIHAEEGYVRVEPGVIRDDLNKVLQPYRVFFGPETSTASRAMIGGMIGNNSSGLHSMVWGDTRQHLLRLKVLLDDGSEVVFEPLHPNELLAKTTLNTREGEIYRQLHQLLSDPATKSCIEKDFPKASVQRRNTGYAIDLLGNEQVDWHLQKLWAGSEGTLGIILEAELRVLPLPPAEVGLLCVHFDNLQAAFEATVLTHSTSAYAIELVDRSILRYTEAHPTYQAYRFFIEGDPAAILMIELRGNLPDDIHNQAQYIRSLLQGKGLGYAFPLILGPLTQQVWEVRKAGLGLIRNLPGDVQAVNLIEDCAVAVEDLPAYMQDVQKLLSGLGVQACYYAHAGAGEIHVEPFLNLKTKEGLHLFRQILAQCAQLVRQYRGSLSGEHGDGRLRGEYISRVLGSEAYALFAQIKNIFDPQGIFNKGKIVGAPAMDEHLRFAVGQPLQEEKTLLDFTKQESMLRLAEKCSGSGDCRKTHYSGGTMCPSFMATRQEKDTTRARANLLRQYWSQPPQVQDVDDEVVKSVLDLCLSCKACKMECPSQVDMTKLKAEFLQHYFDRRGVDRRSYWMARFVQLQKWASLWPSAYNWLIQHPKINLWIKSWMGIAKSRSLPLQAPKTLMHWARKEQKTNASSRKVYLLADEFTNYHDVPIGQAAYRLLQTLGYKVEILDLQDSGRAALSKGLLRYARQLAHKNLQKIQSEIPSNLPVIGIEPAALLTYRDEYPDLVSENWKPVALRWAKQCFMFEEFLMEEYKKGYITSENFTALPEKIQLHTHCYQKALGISHLSEQMLKIVPQLEVEVIPSGCCGMAGSFGYEEEHFEVSQQIAELVLLPALRQKHDKAVCAPGHSCRHQIKDALAVVALHPIEVLWRAVKK